MGRMQTEIELAPELIQQGGSNEVSVSIEGVVELKRKVKIKGEKKEALLTLRQKPAGSIHMLSVTPKLLSGIKDSHHGPMKMEILLEPTSKKLKVGYELTIDEVLKYLKLSMGLKTILARDSSIDFLINFYHLNREERNFRFTHTVFSALRPSGA
ncbi:hypothetical protein Tco_1034297 [Tanacetum coccineum]